MGNTQSPDERFETAEREALLIRLKREGKTHEQVGEALGISKQRVSQIYNRILREIPAQELNEYRKEQLLRFDYLLTKASEVLERDHLTVSHGRIIRQGDGDEAPGDPILDDGPTLNAIQAILRIEADRRKLLGLDAAERQEITAMVETRPEVLGLVERARAEMKQKEAELRGESS